MDMEILELVNKIPLGKFNLLAEQHGLSTEQRDRVRRVLVDGIAVSEVASQAKVSEEAIRKVLRKLIGSSFDRSSLTASHFDLTVSRMSRMSDKNLQLARRVLVNGEAIIDVADSAGLSRSTLYKVVEKVRAQAIPEGWRTITVTLPEYCAQGVEQMEIEAYTDYLEHDKEQ